MNIKFNRRQSEERPNQEDIDTVVIQFVSTTGGDTWGTANIIGGKATAISNINYSRIVRILRK